MTDQSKFEAARELFGEHPGDVLQPIKTAAEALDWVEAICTSIRVEAQGKGNLVQIRKLAEAAEYLSLEFSSWASCQYEEMHQRLHDAGVPGCDDGG